MRRLVGVVALVALSGCATVDRMESGSQNIGERMTLILDDAWNQVSLPGQGPAQTWTMEGLPVDVLLIYSGLKDGQAIHRAPSSGQKSFNFRASMQPDEIVGLFEGFLTRDGSQFQLTRLEPASFGGSRGFHFEYALTRRVDGVVLSGMGYGTVSRGELFALIYQAPRLAFFARHKDRVEQIARSARVKA
ncbi:MAG TPA: hypothetical protein VH600_23855 [Burkholderiales bacterium]